MSARLLPLSALNVVFFNLGHVANANSCDLAQIAGRLQTALLQAALDECAAQRIAMRGRVRRHGTRPWLVAGPQAVRVPLRVLQRPEVRGFAELLPEVLAATWTRPLDLALDMPLRAVLYECEGCSFLQLVSSHVWSDAQAGFRLMHDVAAAYTRRMLPPYVRRAEVPADDIALRPLFAAHGWGTRLRGTLAALGAIAGDALRADLVWPVASSERGATGLAKHELPPTWIDRLRRNARAEAASVHALLMLALVRASAEAAGREGVFRFTDQFSLRPSLGVVAGARYDTLMLPYTLRLDSRRSDRELLADIGARVGEMRSGGAEVEYYRLVIYDLLSRVLPRRFATAWVGRLVAKSSVLVSNPGVIPFRLERFGNVGVADYFSFPQLFPPGRALLLFSTFRDAARLFVVFDRAAFPDGADAALVDPFLRQLAAALQRLESSRSARPPAMHHDPHDPAAPTHAAPSAAERRPDRWRRYVDLVFARRWLVLLAALLTMGALASALPKLRFDNTPDSFFLRGDETLSVYEDFKRRFAGDEYSLVMLQLPEAWTPETIAKVRKLTSALGALPHVRRSTSITNVRHMQDDGGELRVGDFIPADTPPAALAAKRAEALTHPYYEGLYLSGDGRHAAVIVETEIIAGEIGYKIALAQRIRALAASAEYAALQPKAVGAPIIDADVRTIVTSESALFGALAYLVVTVGFAIVFHSAIGALLPPAIALLSVLASFSLMALVGAPVTIVTPIIPSFMISVGVGASVFLMTEVYLERAKRPHDRPDTRGALADAMRHAGPASILACLTSAGALFAFSSSDIAPVGQLGLVMGSGLLFGLVLTYVLVPLAFAFVRERAGVPAGASLLARRVGWMASLNGWVRSRSQALLGLALLLAVVAGIGASQLRTDYFYLGNFKERTGIRQDYAAVDAVFHGSASIELVLGAKGNEPFTQPRVLAAMSEFQRRIESGAVVPAKTYSLASVVQEINRTLHGARPEAYVVPAERSSVAQYLLLFEASGYDELRRVSSPAYDVARINVRVPSLPDSRYGEIVARIHAEHAALLAPLGVSMQVTGLVPMWIRISEYLGQTEAQALLMSACVVAVAIALVMRSVVVGVLLTLMNALPILLALGVMGWLGVPLDPYTILIAGIAIGLLDDDTIHFAKAVKARLAAGEGIDSALEHTASTSGLAMLSMAAVLLAAFLFYSFSSVASLTKFGVLGALIVLLGIAAEVLLTPALLLALHRRGWFKG